MPNMYRAGIIGCGGIGRKHAAAFAEMPDVDLVAGADPSDRRRDDYLALGMQRWYDDPAEMLSQEELDVVTVCTPPTSHAEWTIAAAEAGARGIICEKPMAMTVPECDAMIEACERNGTELAIGHQRRYGEQFIRGRDLLASGDLGEPVLLYGATPGADIMLWGVHWLDMFHFLMPEHSVVSAMGQVDVESQKTTSHGFVEDSLVGFLTFDNGVRAVITCGQIAEPRGDLPYHAEIHIHGTEGMFIATDVGCMHFTKDGLVADEIESPFETPDGKPRVEMWVDQAQELIRGIEQNVAHQCDGHAGRRTIEIATAVWESALRRRVVELPFEAGESPLQALWRG